ncbi:MAG: hypothetical protein JW910_13980 [Anaerolineae bacterium]|nr:hypothetical protein [Anaerolineae bacterium]
MSMLFAMTWRWGRVWLACLIGAASAWAAIGPTCHTAAATTLPALNVPLQVTNPLDVPRINEPVTSGVPLPRELAITDPGSLRLVDAAGNAIPAQFTPLARWGGSPDDPAAPLRWVLVDFQATVGPQQTVMYTLQNAGPGPAPQFPLALADGIDALTVDTGVALFSISKADGRLSAPGLAAPVGGQVRSGGTVYTESGSVSVRVALDGPMRVSIHVTGSYRDASGVPLLDYTNRYWFYAGQSGVRLFHTAENNTLCPLAEFEQLACHDIGSGGSVAFNDLSVIVPAALGGDLAYQAGGMDKPVSGSLTGDVVLYQDSSGTDHWDTYPTMTDWEGNPLDARPRMQAYVSFRGYRITSGEALVSSGDQAAGWMSVSGAGGTWTVGVRDFWQNFPKALRARSDGTLEIGLFPDEFGPTDYAFTLRAGEHKTHEIAFGTNSTAEMMLRPLFAAAPPEWYVNSGAFGHTTLPDWTDWPEYEQYILDQLDISPGHEGWDHLHDTLLDAIESTDFYGIFDYGDWPIDYEGYGVAPLNLKYDNDYGMWLQWARGGDWRWFELAQAADRHAADVDILHNLHDPRHWGDGIIFAHSEHDEAGFTNPHRNINSGHPDLVYGVRGMLLTTYLTGYEETYESALELADCIEYRLHNDEHLCAFFPPGECSGMGYALDAGLYAAGSRPAANALSIAVIAYRATADPRYLAVADAVVAWAQPERQPYMNGPTGEDQEMRPWVLNLYLRALAAYLDMREEFGLPDTYGAREAFLAYVNWLHAYAWLDLAPAETGPRAAYPYAWWFDGRQGDPADEWAEGNNIPSVTNWLLLGADVMAYAYHLTGQADYLEWAAILFRTGSLDPWFEGDSSMYSESKQTINGIVFGHTFLYEWAAR